MINLALSFKSLSILRVILLDSWSISASCVILKYARQRVWGVFCLFFMMDRTSVLEYVCLFSGALALRFIAWIKAGLMDWIWYWHVCQQYSFHNNTGWQFTIKKHFSGEFLKSSLPPFKHSSKTSPQSFHATSLPKALFSGNNS